MATAASFCSPDSSPPLSVGSIALHNPPTHQGIHANPAFYAHQRERLASCKTHTTYAWSHLPSATMRSTSAACASLPAGRPMRSSSTHVKTPRSCRVPGSSGACYTRRQANKRWHGRTRKSGPRQLLMMLREGEGGLGCAWGVVAGPYLVRGGDGAQALQAALGGHQGVAYLRIGRHAAT